MLSPLGGQEWENTQGHFGWELHQAKSSNGRRSCEAPDAVAGWYIYWKILRRFKTKTTPFIRGVWKYILSLSLSLFSSLEFLSRIDQWRRARCHLLLNTLARVSEIWRENTADFSLHSLNRTPLSPFLLTPVYHILISGVPLKEGICAWLIFKEGNWSQPMQSCRIIFPKSRKMYARDLKGRRAKEESVSKRGEMGNMKIKKK